MDYERGDIVSVCVLAYNSGVTIVDTLNSIFNQTFKQIELIISDDGSNDDTLNKAEEWVKSHLNRFINVRILTVPVNSGTPANCNRAYKASIGSWIKFIAADDCLLPTCIETNIKYISNNPGTRILYTSYQGFYSLNGNFVLQGERPNLEFNTSFNTTPDKQLKIYLEKCGNISPSAFIQKSLIEELGGFIEKYKVFEDTPFFTKVLLSNTKIHFIPEDTVLYRLNSDSVTRDISRKTFYKKSFMDVNLQFRKEMIFPIYHWYNLNFWIPEYSFRILYSFTIKVLKNKRSAINNLFYLLFKGLNPYYLISKFLK